MPDSNYQNAMQLYYTIVLNDGVDSIVVNMNVKALDLFKHSVHANTNN